MTDQEIQQENQAEKFAPKIEGEKLEAEKEPLKMSAADYIERALADKAFGDSRRDELALAALKFASAFKRAY